jgi:hypothetical protein
MKTITSIDRRMSDWVWAVGSAACVVAAFLIVNPFVQMPFDDDWCYSFIVRQFLSTGRITYTGWSAPVLITHTLWGAGFCKIFGYSFITLRFSTLPFAIGSAVLAYYLGRAAGLRPPLATFASLTLCLSPLFLPLATSFMTDVPALFYTLAGLYAFMRSAQSVSTNRAIGWLALGTLLGIIGGMGRQTVWVAPICVIPWVIFLRRRGRLFALAGVMAWVLVVLDIYLTLRWFSRQPWVYLDPPIIDCIRMGLAAPHIAFTNVVMVALTTVMFALPAMIPFVIHTLVSLWQRRRTPQAALAAFVILLLSIAISFYPAFGIGPWLYNIVTFKGVIGPLELSGRRAFTMPLSVRGFISALVLLATFLLAGRATECLLTPRKTLGMLWRFFTLPESRPVLVIFALAYFLLMIIRSSQDLVFDRYCLPLIPCLIIPLLGVQMNCPRKPYDGHRLAFVLSLLLFGIYTLYAFASTQDNLALAAARRDAVDRLESHGIPKTRIAGGFEYDFYTQLEAQSHINRYGITNPANSFDPFAGYTPVIKPLYRLEYPQYSDTKPSPFGQVDYISWLPPFHRSVLIDEFANPWWLSTQNKNQPPSNFEVDYEN